MSGFEDREKGFEKKYVMEEQHSFEIEAKCSKLFGLWVAEQLGLSGADANTYASSMVEANLEEPGFEDVIRKAKRDLDEKNVDVSDHLMRSQLEKAVLEAQRIINEENSN